MAFRVRRWLTGTAGSVLIALVMVAALTMVVVAEIQINAQSDCLSRWADRYTERVQRLTGASNARNEAFDKLLHELNTPDAAKRRAAFEAYLLASDKYRVEQRANPIPESPRLNC